MTKDNYNRCENSKFRIFYWLIFHSKTEACFKILIQIDWLVYHAFVVHRSVPSQPQVSCLLTKLSGLLFAFGLRFATTLRTQYCPLAHQSQTDVEPGWDEVASKWNKTQTKMVLNQVLTNVKPILLGKNIYKIACVLDGLSNGCQKCVDRYTWAEVSGLVTIEPNN